MRTKLLFYILFVTSLSVMAQGTIKRKICNTCGKVISQCQYKGNHPAPEPVGYDVTFTCNVSSASLYIDGKASGSASCTRYLKTGIHNIKITAVGYKDFITSIDVSKSKRSFSFSLIKELDAISLYSKGKEYYDKKDYIDAVNWYRKAAEQGHADAQCFLGHCYDNGQGVTKDYEEAVKWYQKAAEQGNATAQRNLGSAFFHGHGVTQDYIEAVKWFRKAAEQGNATAQYMLGYCYYFGFGITRSMNEAMKWYHKAAEQGIAPAQCEVALHYMHSVQDKVEAVKWYRKAAEQGYAPGQFQLGYCYMTGKGVTLDYIEAVQWYRKAAEQGEANAQYYIGYCYDIGQGVTKDENEAIKWYREAARQGNPTAQRKLKELGITD